MGGGKWILNLLPYFILSKQDVKNFKLLSHNKKFYFIDLWIRFGRNNCSYDKTNKTDPGNF